MRVKGRLSDYRCKWRFPLVECRHGLPEHPPDRLGSTGFATGSHLLQVCQVLRGGVTSPGVEEILSTT